MIFYRSLRAKEDKWKRIIISDETRIYLTQFLDHDKPQVIWSCRMAFIVFNASYLILTRTYTVVHYDNELFQKYVLCAMETIPYIDRDIVYIDKIMFACAL